MLSRRNVGKGPLTGVELWCHMRKEFNKLSVKEKKELSEWRKEKKATEDKNEQQVSILKQTIEELQVKVAALATSPLQNQPRDPLAYPLHQFSQA